MKLAPLSQEGWRAAPGCVDRHSRGEKRCRTGLLFAFTSRGLAVLPCCLTTRHLFPALFFAAALAASSFAATVPDYKLGDVATEDVITPIPLVVPHPDATEALKQKLLQQSPSIVRFMPQAAADTEANLRAAVAKTREKFFTAMRAALQDRAPLESDLGTPAFTAALEYVSRDAPKNLPLETLTPIWVRGQSDQPFVDTLAKPLRDAMAQLVLTSGENETPLPNDPPVRLVTVKNFSEPVVIDSFEPNGQTVSSRKLISLRQAQRIVETQFAGQERLGDFVSGFVRPNCRFDAGLTDIVRAKRSNGFAVNDTFEAAQVIVHKGQTIDRRALSALAVLREKSLIGTLQNKLEQEQSVAGEIKSQTKWIAASLLLILLVLLLIYSRIRHRTVGVAPAVFTGPALEGASQAALPPGSEAAAWQARALVAEGKAERAHAAIRSGVLGWMKEKVFSTLFSQRQELLTANERATSEINDLEQRLEQIHAPLQERIQAYEQRIKELEEELVARKMPKPVPPAPLSLRRKVERSETPSAAAASPSREAEAALAERERNVGEAEARMAERARDLAEMDALLRARERLIVAAQGLPPNKNRIVIAPPPRGQQSDVVKDRAQAGLN